MIMDRSFAAALLCLALSGAAAGGEAPSTGAQDFRRELQQKVTFEFVDAPLAEAFGWLQRESGVSFDLEPEAAETLARPVTIKMKDVPLLLAVKWLTRLAGADYEVRGQAVVVGPERIVTRTYDVSALLAGEDGAEAAGRGRSGDLFVDLVALRYHPWDGHKHAIKLRGGELSVTHIRAAHEEIKELLGIMHEACAARQAGKSDPSEEKLKAQPPPEKPLAPEADAEDLLAAVAYRAGVPLVTYPACRPKLLAAAPASPVPGGETYGAVLDRVLKQAGLRRGLWNGVVYVYAPPEAAGGVPGAK